MINLTFVQKSAVRLMREKINAAVIAARQAQVDYQQLVGEVASECGIIRAEQAKWRFDEESMAFVPKEAAKEKGAEKEPEAEKD